MLFPPRLKAGDRIGIVSPARKISPAELAPALSSLKEWGLVPVLGPHVHEVFRQYAGEDKSRAADLQTMISDPGIKAILAARGGYGTLRIVDTLDLKPLKNNPKWIIGFSDLTTITTSLFNLGVATIHGPMGISWNGKTGDEQSREYLRQTLMEGPAEYSIVPQNGDIMRTGSATGRLIGGNLSILSQLIGTTSDFDTEGCILFLEDLDEYLYHVDRMMVHLRRSGKLGGLAGLMIGGFTDLKDNDTPFGQTVEEIVMDAVGGYKYPVCFGFPTGHWPQNYPLIVGATATLKVSHTQVELSMKED